MNKPTTKRKTTCKAYRCSRPVRCRGLCNACYSALLRAIAAGNLTWGDAVGEGLAESDKRKQRRATTGLAAVLNEREKELKRCE